MKLVHVAVQLTDQEIAIALLRHRGPTLEGIYIVHRDCNVWVQPGPWCLEYNRNCFGAVDGMPAGPSTQTQLSLS